MSNSKQVLSLAVEIGDTLLRNGGEIYRVEDTILKILDAYGVEEYDVYVLSNGIFASANEHKEDSSSIVRHVPLGSMHLDRIAAMNQLSREICDGALSLEEAWMKLKEYKHIPSPPSTMMVFFCGLGSAAFCYLYGGSILDAACAFFLGCLLELYRTFTKKHKTSKFIKNIIGSAMVTAGSLLFLNLGLPVLQDKIVIGTIMPLVPGIALTTSIRDLFNGDYLSGAIHLLDALLIAICIAFGVGAIIILYQHIPGGVRLL